MTMTAAVAAGIDAGKFYLDVGIEPSRQHFRVANAVEGIEDAVARLQGQGVRKVVLEAIGPFAQPVVRRLALAGFEVGLINPRRIKAFRDAEGKRAKTDRLDARLIARFAVQMTDALRPVPTEGQQRLKALAARRRQLVEMSAMEKTRLKQTSDPRLCESHRYAIAALTAERIRIEADLEASLAAEPPLARKQAILRSLPGFGPVVSTTLITDLPELGALDRRAIASLAGLAPHPSQSGTSIGRNQIGGGRPCVRTALYMAALVASRSNPRFRAEYQAMRIDGKPAKVALIAIARKLLVLANSLVKNDMLYDPAHT
ncbi:MAG: IS110 family transposase, partial [Pseudolabrys sp.]|nr:IS110 family transposase [Pseudolabrys sp.]